MCGVIHFIVSSQQPFNNEQWGHYQAMNRLWAEAVVRVAHETDLIWVHDYHLLVAPLVSQSAGMAGQHTTSTSDGITMVDPLCVCSLSPVVFAKRMWVSFCISLSPHQRYSDASPSEKRSVNTTQHNTKNPHT